MKRAPAPFFTRSNVISASLLFLIGFAQLTFVARAWYAIITMTLPLLPSLSLSASLLLFVGLVAIALFTVLCLLMPILIVRSMHQRAPVRSFMDPVTGNLGITIRRT